MFENVLFAILFVDTPDIRMKHFSPSLIFLFCFFHNINNSSPYILVHPNNFIYSIHILFYL